MTVGILSGSHAAEDRLQNQSEQLFKQANERLEQPAPAWKDSPTGGRSCTRLFRAFYENKNHLLSCSCCVFIVPRSVLFFPASRPVCCLFVRYFTATLPIHEFVSLCFLWYSPRGVACILFYFAYCVELNLTQKVSDDHIPKSLGLPVPIADWLSSVFPCLFGVFRFLMSILWKKVHPKRRLRFISSCYYDAT